MANTLSSWDLNLRCISLITTLESLLLKDEEKVISGTVKDRLAKIFTKNNEEERKTKEAFFHIYNVRNDMAHKAIRAEIDIQQLSTVQSHLLRRLIDININRGCLTKAGFINGIRI